MKPVVITVGNEIIYGERIDENKAWMLSKLWKEGLSASLALSLPDDEELIGWAIKNVKSFGFSPFFVSGGIGGTHDDRTRQGVALGLGRPLVLHEECFNILKARYGSRLNEQRTRMAWLPEGSLLIPNPIGAPGFMVDDVYCFPGFPEMLRPMFEWVLENLFNLERVNRAVREWNLEISEGIIGPEIEKFTSKHKGDLSVGLYPHIVEGNKQRLTIRLRCVKEKVEEFSRELEKIIDQFLGERL